MPDIKNGATVRIKTFVPEGPVRQTRWDEETNGPERLVEYVDDDGETQQRWCADAELEWVSDPVQTEPENDEEEA